MGVSPISSVALLRMPERTPELLDGSPARSCATSPARQAIWRLSEGLERARREVC
jgi:hypothetical protein